MSEPLSDQRLWVSAHLYYHGDLDDVVTNVVNVAVRETAPYTCGSRYFFLRHWEGGPHVRLRVYARSSQAHDTVTSIVRDRAEDYFARCPSRDRVHADEYREMRRLALRLEPWVDPATDLSPNNSVTFVPYHREHDKYGHGPAIEAVETHFNESSDIAQRAVGDGMGPAERNLLGFFLLVSSWRLACSDEAALIRWIVAGGRRFDLALGMDADRQPPLGDDRRARLLAVARQVMANHVGPSGSGASGTFRHRWQQSIARLLASLAEVRIPAPTVEPQDGQSTLAIVDHCAHLACNRLGLSLGIEAMLRSWAHLAILDAAGQ